MQTLASLKRLSCYNSHDCTVGLTGNSKEKKESRKCFDPQVEFKCIQVKVCIAQLTAIAW